MAGIHIVADAHNLEAGHQYLVRVSVSVVSATGPVEILHQDSVIDVPGASIPPPSLEVTVS